MGKFDLYRDIRMRVGDRFCIGVVGPVRTGKSTFARNFMRQLLPAGSGSTESSVPEDELPERVPGTTAVTAEPLPVPETPVNVPVGDGETLAVQTVDCVGFPIPQAGGITEDGEPRMLKTPWQEEPLTFAKAARLGTRKVMEEQAAAGLVITTDGSFGELPAPDFREAQKEVIREMQDTGKPFLVIVNSARPGDGDFQKLLELLLLEFPLNRVIVRIRKFLDTLDNSHWLKQSLFDSVRETMKNLHKIPDVSERVGLFENPNVRSCKAGAPDLSDGSVPVTLRMQENLYYQILSEMTGADIRSEYQLISMLRDMAVHRREYESCAEALQEARRTGYGVISPQGQEIRMQEPLLFRQGSRYGVKVRAEAPSIHLIRADIRTEVSPVVGSEEQARELIGYIKESGGGEDDARALIFGKSVRQLAEEGIQAKLSMEGQEERRRLQAALSRIVNESRGKIFFILI